MICKVDKWTVGARQGVGYYERSKRPGRVTFITVVLALYVTGYSAEEASHDHDLERAQTTNVTCPVMPDMKVDTDIFTDYQGKRVYFCCVNCRATFQKNPEKYLALLPQFSGAASHTAHEHGDTTDGVALPELIEPAGIATLSCLILTVGMALLRRKRPRLLLKWHKRLGITTLVLALIHLTLVLIAH